MTLLFECDNLSCMNFVAQMWWYKWMPQRECGRAMSKGPGEAPEACTPHEVSWVSLTINEVPSLGIVLDQALLYSLVQLVACKGPWWGACSCACWEPRLFAFSMIALREMHRIKIAQACWQLTVTLNATTIERKYKSVTDSRLNDWNFPPPILEHFAHFSYKMPRWISSCPDGFSFCLEYPP